MEEALIKRLLATTAITNLVSNRINWMTLPDAFPRPNLTLQVSDGGTDYTHEGLSSLQYPRIQFNCWGNTYAQAKAVARALFSELNTEKDVDAIHFEDAIMVYDQDMPKETLKGGTDVYRVVRDFLVPHRPI